MNFREEGEIGSKSREEGEIGSESREKGDLPPCPTPSPYRIPLVVISTQTLTETVHVCAFPVCFVFWFVFIGVSK